MAPFYVIQLITVKPFLSMPHLEILDFPMFYTLPHLFSVMPIKDTAFRIHSELVPLNINVVICPL